MPATKMKATSHKRHRSRHEKGASLQAADEAFNGVFHTAKSEPYIKSEQLKSEGGSIPHTHHQEKRRRVVGQDQQESHAIWDNPSLQYMHQFSATRSISPLSQMILEDSVALGYYSAINGGNSGTPAIHIAAPVEDARPLHSLPGEFSDIASVPSHGLQIAESVIGVTAVPTHLTPIAYVGQNSMVAIMSPQAKTEEADLPSGLHQTHAWSAASALFTTPCGVQIIPQHVHSPELYAPYTAGIQQHYLHEGHWISTPGTPVVFGYGVSAFHPQPVSISDSMLWSPSMSVPASRAPEMPSPLMSAEPGSSAHAPEVLWSVDVLPGQQYKSPPVSKTGKRGPFRNPVLREQTAQTRKRGSCIRCKMQRIRCETNELDPDGTCLTCKRVTSAKTGRFPCLRYKITDIALYKQGQVPGYEWTNRWDQSISDEIKRWASTDVKVIRICEGYSEHGMLFKVRKFIPEKGDKLERTWDYRGTKMSAKVPPYALVDMEEGKAICDQYINDSLGSAFNVILGPHNGILMATYQQAVFLSQSSTATPNTLLLLQQTLRLWMAVRLSTKTTFIIGEERLGMPSDILDRTNPTPGKIPVPPVFGAQIDVILIHHIQARLRRELLERLQETIFQNKQANWFVTYLVIFILLHNTSLIIEHDSNYATKHGMKRRFAREAKVKEYHTGANILLAHFHYCNKGVYPFSDECKDTELQNLGYLNDAQSCFIRNSRALIRSNELEWKGIRDRGEYESPWYYVSQMYQRDWKPISMEGF